MAGTPIKTMRRAGIDIPELGVGASKSSQAEKAARARVPKPVPKVQTTEEMLALAKEQLLDMMINGGGYDLGARVNAAKALIQALTPAQVPVVVQQNVTQPAPAAPPAIPEEEALAILARHRRVPKDEGRGEGGAPVQ
jgi:hypothetical protein